MIQSISILLLAIALTLLLENSKKVKMASLSIASLIAALNIAYTIIHQLSNDGINQAVLAHIHHTVTLESILRFWWVTVCAVALLAATPLFVKKIGSLDLRVNAYKKKHEQFTFRLVSIAALLLALFLSPFTQDLARLHSERMWHAKLKIPKTLDQLDILAPPISHTSPKHKSDFIIILAESLESSFFNPSYYPQLTPNLNKLIAEKGRLLKGIDTLTLSNWTDAGITAALCGIPMSLSYTQQQKSSLMSNKINTTHNSTSMRGETCIGDILSKDEYELSFFGGSDFGEESKSLLMFSQGVSRLHLTQNILTFRNNQTHSTLTTEWGVYDDTLFEYFFETLSTQNNSTPKGNILLTVDTHLPGYLSPSCDRNDELTGILAAINCTDSMLERLIRTILESKAHENTVVFLLSDHLFPGELPAYTGAVQTTPPKRENLFVVFNSKLNTELYKYSSKRIATPLDVAPTILAHLGYEIETLNYGRNLESQSATLAEMLGKPVLDANIVKLRQKLLKKNPTHKSPTLTSR